MSKAGWPGELAASGDEDVVATCHRVCAALGTGSQSIRSTNVMTPEAAAAIDSRREAVRSSKGAFPQGSIMTAPTSPHLTISAPARSTASVSGASTRTRSPGSMPSSASPSAWTLPVWRQHRFSRTQMIGRFAGQARIPTIMAKAAAALLSPIDAANTSCSARCANPPSIRLSIASVPNVTRFRASAPFSTAD